MLWRHARSCYQHATAAGVASADKQALLGEALKCIKSAIQFDGSNSDSRRWFGTILQEHSAFQGFKQQIGDAFEVEAQWKAAIAINPDDATAHHLLGRWCFTVADMAWYQRSIASTLFAEPPSSSYEEARDYFSGAERIAPDFWKMNQYQLAQCEGRLGNTAEGVRWLQRALSLPVRTVEDQDVQAKALVQLLQWDAAAGATAAAAEAKRQKLAAQLAE
jgi:tetratricopeptide (TPR) repeat protein